MCSTRAIYRVQVNVTYQLQKIDVCFDQDGLETSAENRAVSLMSMVVTLCVDTTKMLHGARQVAVGRMHQEVEVVRHEAKGMDHDTVPTMDVSKKIKKLMSVVVRKEDVLLSRSSRRPRSVTVPSFVNFEALEIRLNKPWRSLVMSA